MERITYQEYLKTHPNPITDISDETVEEAVKSWFKYRYLGFENVDKFTDIFRRNVALYYPMYSQKLRIEPGVSTYDWLVSDYRERQLKTKGTSENTQTHGQDLTTTSETTTGSNATVYDSGTTNIKTGGQTNTKTGDDTTVRSGSVSEKSVEGLRTTTVSPHVQRVTKTDNDHSEWAGNQSVQATVPMSKEYSTFIEPTGKTDSDGKPLKEYYERAYQHMPSLNWETLTAQGQDGHRGYNTDDNTVTESYKYDSGVEGDITTTKGSADSPSTRETTYNDDQSKTSHDTTDKLTYDSVTDTGTHTGKDSQTSEGTKTGSSTTTYGNLENSGSDERTDREQVTGRNEDPATLLMRATAFIEQSSAFMWFKEQIESCFTPWYDEEGGLI